MTEIKSKPSPALNQGTKFKKYQQKIKSKEGFSNPSKPSNQSNQLTSQTKQIIDANDYSKQQSTIDELRQAYQSTLQEYEDLAQKISSGVSGYISRVNPDNPYINKVIQFTTGQMCYVTNQGVAKYIPSQDSLQQKKQMFSSSNIIKVSVPWQTAYSSPGTQIPTTPYLVSGTPMQPGQGIGNEGSNIFVNQLLPDNVQASYMGCYAPSSNNDNMTFIGGSPPPATNASIQNGTFSQPVLSNNSYQYINSSSQVPGWTFTNAALLNNSSAWGYPVPYPNGNQCASIQSVSSINTLVTLNTGVNYTITFYACGRNCCSGQNTNPLNVQLYTTNNAFISTIYQCTPPVNVWTNYTATFTVPTSQSYKLFFSGTINGDQSSALQNISISSSNTSNTSSSGNYTYNDCMQAAAQGGYQYFALQNVNTQTSKGYCAVSNSSPAISQYGDATVPSKMVSLWSSNTSGQSGNTAVLSSTGSLQVLNTSGQAVYSTPSSNASPSNYLGCYGDKSSRAMTSSYTNGSQQYSNAQCQQAAQQGGYQYYGLQNSTSGTNAQCFFSNDLSQTTQYGAATNCTKISDGSWSGGGWSNAVYNTTAPESNYYIILQDDGNMCIYRGTGPNDNQGSIWCSGTDGQQQVANPSVAASNGKYGQNWMPSTGTLAPGDFIGSSDGKMALVMQTDGNLVLYTYQMQSNCQKMGDGNMGGGLNANAAYDIGVTANADNIGKLGYIDSDANLYTYPDDNIAYSNTYSTYKNANTSGNDLQNGSIANTTVDACQSSCNDNEDCAGFVFDNTNSVCYLKNNNMYPYGSSSMTGSNTSDIYFKNKMPLNPPKGVSQKVNTTNSIRFNAYINKGDIGENTSFGISTSSNVQKQQLNQLQTTLNMLSNQINTLTGKFGQGLSNANNQSNQNSSALDGYLQTIQDTNSEIKHVATATTVGLQNILKDSDITVLKQNYEYLFWSILAAGTVLITMNITKKNG